MWKAWPAPGPHRSDTARREIQSIPQLHATWAIAHVSMSAPMASGKRWRIGSATCSVQKESDETIRPTRTGWLTRPARASHLAAARSEEE